MTSPETTATILRTDVDIAPSPYPPAVAGLRT
jgi:hypothetical protein